MSFFPLAEAAADAAVNPPNTGMSSLIFMLAFFAVLYWMIWRPQSKRAKEHRQMLEGLGKGDEIITSGGILGKVNHVKDDFVTIGIADNVEIRVQKASITNVVPKGTIKSLN